MDAAPGAVQGEDMKSYPEEIMEIIEKREGDMMKIDAKIKRAKNSRYYLIEKVTLDVSYGEFNCILQGMKEIERSKRFPQGLKNYAERMRPQLERADRKIREDIVEDMGMDEEMSIDVNLLEDVMAEICARYCKYPSIVDEDTMNDMCDECPFERLGI